MKEKGSGKFIIHENEVFFLKKIIDVSICSGCLLDSCSLRCFRNTLALSSQFVYSEGDWLEDVLLDLWVKPLHAKDFEHL